MKNILYIIADGIPLILVSVLYLITGGSFTDVLISISPLLIFEAINISFFKYSTSFKTIFPILSVATVVTVILSGNFQLGIFFASILFIVLKPILHILLSPQISGEKKDSTTIQKTTSGIKILVTYSLIIGTQFLGILCILVSLLFGVSSVSRFLILSETPKFFYGVFIPVIFLLLGIFLILVSIFIIKNIKTLFFQASYTSLFREKRVYIYLFMFFCTGLFITILYMLSQSRIGF